MQLARVTRGMERRTTGTTANETESLSFRILQRSVDLNHLALCSNLVCNV